MLRSFALAIAAAEPDGTASYEVEAPNGGSVENHTAAIMIGSEGVTQVTPELGR